MTAALTTLAPVKGVEYDKTNPDPEVRQRWLDQRRGGITATEVRDWTTPAQKRAITTAKVTGVFQDLSHVANVRHGNLREPVIADWARVQFGVEPTNAVYSHGENPRHMASPDGVSLDPFSRELEIGTDAAVLLEIKTSVHDLTPGELDGTRTLVLRADGTWFDKSGYYDQMQWQMYVMNATATIFVWEVRDNVIDRDTGTYSPVGPPEWAVIPRDEERIALLLERAESALEEIDAARLAYTVGMPPVSVLPSEHSLWVAELLAARDNEAVAVAAKTKAWDALKAVYLAEDAPDQSIDAGWATITVSTGKPGSRPEVDMDAAREEDADLIERYEALISKHTTTVATPGRRTLTITGR